MAAIPASQLQNKEVIHFSHVMASLLKLLLVGAGLLGLVYLAVCLFLHLRQTRMVFLPSPVVELNPAELGLDYEEIWLPISSNPKAEGLHGWWISTPEPEQGVLLYLHGNGINIGANLDHASRFQQIGLSVLLMDYRGYGQSKGKFPTEAQVYEDADLMWQYLTQERNIPPERIFVYGHSLGGAIAIELATRHPYCAGLIVDGSFTSIRDMVRLNPSFNLFPIDLILTQQFASIDKVSTLQMPVLFIHGIADARVPASMSQRLFEAAPEPKQIYLVPEAGHNNVADTAGFEYFRAVQQLMEQAIEQQATAY